MHHVKERKEHLSIVVMASILVIFGVFPIMSLIIRQFANYAKKRSVAKKYKIYEIKSKRWLKLFLKSMQERKGQIPNFDPELLRLLPD